MGMQRDAMRRGGWPTAMRSGILSMLVAALACLATPTVAALDWNGGNLVTPQIGDPTENLGQGFYPTSNGDRTGTPLANANHVAVNGSAAISGNIYGGSSVSSQQVSGNRVSLAGSADVLANGGFLPSGLNAGSVFGGYAAAGSNANVIDNHVTMDSAYAGTVAGSVFGGLAQSGTVAGNSVAMTGGVVDQDVIGGHSITGDARRNTVRIGGGSVNGSVYGGYSETVADGNQVVMLAGSATNIYGGYIDAMSASSASGNTVTLKAGSVLGDVYGGWGDDYYTVTTGNTVNVEDGFAFSGYSTLMGGKNSSSIVGNTLNTAGRDFSLMEIGNFEHYNFTLSGDDAGETVYYVGMPVETAGTTVNVAFDGRGGLPEAGTTITLFSGTSGVIPSLGSATAANGALFDHEISLEMSGMSNALDVLVHSSRIARESRLVGQTQLAGLHLSRLAGDFHRDIAELVVAAEACRVVEEDGKSAPSIDCARPTLFAGLKGGTSTLDTGGDSEVLLNNLSFITGLGYRVDEVLLAGFIEAGWGWFDSKLGGRAYNDGDRADYLGGGVLARYEQDNFYVEGSLHAGGVASRFDATVRSTPVDYTYRAFYFGSDATFGYRLPLADETSLDLFAGYGWTHSGGDTVAVGANSVHLDSVDSHRLRGGMRWSAARTGMFIPHAGAAAEYEFSGETSGRVHEYALIGAKNAGFTGVGELGLRISDTRYAANIGLEGYLGQRKGFSAKASFAVTF